MNDKDLQEYSDNLATFTDKAVAKYGDAVNELERNMFVEFTNLLASLTYVNGALSTDNDVAAVVAAIDRIFVKWATEGTYTNGVKQYLTDFTEVRKRVLNLHEQLNNLAYTPQFYDLLNKQQKFLVDKTMYDLSQGMLKKYFVEDAKQIVLEGAYLGLSQQQVSKRYRDRLLSTGKTDSYFKRYATQLSRDSVYTYQGQVNQAIAEEYKMDCVRYIGSVISDTRPLCRYLIKEKKRLFKTSELPAILRQFSGTSGLKDNTTASNFFALRGGWGCRHEAIPIRCDD